VPSNGNEDLLYRLLHVYPSSEVVPKKTKKPSEKGGGKSTKKEKTAEEGSLPKVKRPGRKKSTNTQSAPVPVTSLLEEDVYAVFESIHSNRKPPPHLQYQVIAVESKNSPKVAPPQLLYQGENANVTMLSMV